MLIYKHLGCEIHLTKGRGQPFTLWVPTAGNPARYERGRHLKVMLFTDEEAEARRVLSKEVGEEPEKHDIIERANGARHRPLARTVA